jgi:hypothetical protein
VDGPDSCWTWLLGEIGKHHTFISWIGLKTWESHRDSDRNGRPKYFCQKSVVGPSGRVELREGTRLLVSVPKLFRLFLSLF